MSYYGWTNSVNLTGRVLAPPILRKLDNGREILFIKLVVPVYKYYPKREGAIQEAQKDYIFEVMGGNGVVKAVNRRKLNIGDILCITGYLVSIHPPKKYAKGDIYVVATNILCLKGYRGMKYIEHQLDEQEVYNEILKTIVDTKHNGSSNNTGEN